MFTTDDDKIAFDYGPALVADMQLNSTLGDYTYTVEDYQRQYINNGSGIPALNEADYRLTVLVGTTINNRTSMPASTFMPDERLARSDADIILYFLSSPGVISTEPTGDKWFRTTHALGDIVFTNGDGPSSIYTPDVPASPLACASQYQYCNADKDHCGPLASAIDAVSFAAPMFGTTVELFRHANMTEAVAGRFQRLTTTLQVFPLQFSTLFDGLGTESLLAQRTLNHGVQGLLPDDQWQREMTAWWASQLAGLQAFFVQTAAGITFPGLEEYRGYEPFYSFEKNMCSNQKVLSTSHGSFSVFGLSFIYVFGATIITLSFTLEPCLRCCHRRHLKRHEDRGLEHAETYKDVEWSANNTLQLLRFAHENAGVKEWTRCAEDTPVLVDAATPLCVLDLQEPAHPRLTLGTATAMSEASDDVSGRSDVATQEGETRSHNTYSFADELPRTPHSAANDTPALPHGMTQARPAAQSGTSTEVEWLDSPRPVSPLSMPDFRRFE